MGIATNKDNLEFRMDNSEIGTDITQVAPYDVVTTTDNLVVTASRVSLNN